jgi:hypothetical protein
MESFTMLPTINDLANFDRHENYEDTDYLVNYLGKSGIDKDEKRVLKQTVTKISF